MKLVMICLILLNIAVANELATIDKIEGKVKILHANDIRAQKAKLHEKLYKDDLLITYKNGMATLKLDDNSLITLSQKTKLRIKDLKKLEQEEGKVFFNIETQGTNSLEVATNFATIGVKGTKFIINSTDKLKDVSLKSGLVGVSALEGEFEIHTKKKKKLSEFEQYKLANENAFNDYKKKIEEEFIEYKKQFDLHPNNTITFNNNVVNQDSINKDTKKEFLKFEAFQR